LSGGAVSEKAAQYTEAIPVTAGLKLVARVRSDYGLWSAPVRFAEIADGGAARDSGR
jgi:hypothetical protein